MNFNIWMIIIQLIGILLHQEKGYVGKEKGRPPKFLKLKSVSKSQS